MIYSLWRSRSRETAKFLVSRENGWSKRPSALRRQSANAGSVKPFRFVQRHMKGMREGEIRVLRTKVKGLELEAERIEQTMFFSLAEIRWSAHGKAFPTVALVSNLDVLLRAQGCAEPVGEAGAARHLIAAVLALDAFAVRV